MRERDGVLVLLLGHRVDNDVEFVVLERLEHELLVESGADPLDLVGVLPDHFGLEVLLLVVGPVHLCAHTGPGGLVFVFDF